MRRRLAGLACLSLLVGCAKRQPETAFVSWVFVQGPESEGKGLAWDPDLPPLRDGATAVGAQRRTAWAARRVTQQRRLEWWQPMGLPLEPRDLAELDWSVLRADAGRIEAWFGDQGWPDAAVTISTAAAKLWFNGPADDRFWRVVYTVDAGRRVRIDEALVEGDASLPPASRAAVRQLLPPDGRWSSPAHLAEVEASMERALWQHGYAFADVRIVQDRDPYRPRIRFVVDAGDVPTLEAVTTETSGLDDRRISRIVDRRLVPGRRWEGEEVDWMVAQLAGRPEIGDVTVAERRQGDDIAADVVVSPTASARAFSFHVKATGALLMGGVKLDWAERGIGGRLLTVSGASTVDYRLFDGGGPLFPLSGFFGGLQHGPGSTHAVELDGAIAPLAGISGYVGVSGGLETWRGFAEVGVSGEAGLRWKPWGDSEARVFFRGGYHHYFPWPWQQEPFDRAFGQVGGTGEQFARSYEVAAVGVALDIDHLPDGDASDQGTKLAVELIPWGRSLGANWARLSGRLKWHAAAVPNRLTVITQVSVGGHIHDDANGALMGNRFFLGGPGSARGFGFRRLGPPGARAALSEVQVGGDYEIFAAVDARIQAHPVFYVSPFLEVGRVWASGLDQTSETGRVLQQGIRVEDLQPVSGLTFTIANAGRWIEVSTGVRLLNNSGLADPVPRMAIQLRLRPDPRK